MLAIKTAEELIETDIEFQTRRRSARRAPALQAIYRIFLAHGGPVPVEDIVDALPGIPRSALERGLETLDENDLIHLVDGRVETAYPFSARPTPFVVRLRDERDRYVCCAIDALGVAPMVGQRVDVAGRCHHCQESLVFGVDPAGPGPAAQGVMVWVGPRCEGETRALTGL